MTALERHPDPQTQQLRAELEQLTASFHAAAGPSGQITLRARAKKVEVETAALASQVTKLSFTAPKGWTHRAGDYLC
jgi:hypothetical protein